MPQPYLTYVPAAGDVSHSSLQHSDIKSHHEKVDFFHFLTVEESSLGASVPRASEKKLIVTFLQDVVTCK